MSGERRFIGAHSKRDTLILRAQKSQCQTLAGVDRACEGKSQKPASFDSQHTERYLELGDRFVQFFAVFRMLQAIAQGTQSGVRLANLLRGAVPR